MKLIKHGSGSVSTSSPAADCRDLVLTWHTFPQSSLLPVCPASWIHASLCKPGWQCSAGSLAACVSLSLFPALRWDLRAEPRIIQGQAHLESLSWLHLPVCELVIMKSRTPPTSHIACLVLVKLIFCSSLMHLHTFIIWALQCSSSWGKDKTACRTS